MKTKFLYIILTIVFILDLCFISLNENSERFFTKTLLVPLLFGIYIKEIRLNKHNHISILFVLGLLFSFLGDCVLLSKGLFDLGLLSFLIAHLFYIFCFSKLKTLRKRNWQTSIAILSYLVAFLSFTFPHLSDLLRLEVGIYAITISLMLYFALKTANEKLILGAVLFILSDSLLAIDTFITTLRILKLSVMTTYVSAQFFLVQGMLSLNQE